MTTPQPASEPMPGPQDIPPGLQSPNGHSQSQLALALMQQMPQMLAQALVAVLQQVPVQAAGTRYRCAGCAMTRLGWISGHQQACDAAGAAYIQAAAEQAGLEDGDPRKNIPLDFTMFLPDVLRPGGERGMPPVAEGAVMIGGTTWCMEHVPGAPGKTQLLIAQGGMSPAMLAQLAA